MSTTSAAPARPRHRYIDALADNSVFVLGALAAIWLAWLLLSETLHVGWRLLPIFVAFWLVLSYLVHPRIHRILTSVYVPDYFIGRARTSDGLLGDPVNLALEGTESQVHAAMTRAGWIKADDVTPASSWKIVTTTVLRRSYDEAPVSPLLLFGRQQDLAYQQEVSGNPSKRHHVRLWHSPAGWMLPGGHRADWLAAGTFDRAVGLSLFTLQVTHKVAADTDVERDHIVGTLTALGEDVSVRTIEDFSSGYHARNGGGDTIETDGNLPVVDVGKVSDSGVEPGPGWEERMAARANKRPVSITFGAALVGLRVLAGAIVVASGASGASGGKDGPSGVLAVLVGLDVMLADWAVPLVLGAGVVLGLLYLFVGVLTFRGVNWARNTAMACSALLILLTASGFFLGHGIALRENMLGLPLDILVLLALSGEASSRWARRVRTGPGESAHATGDKVVRTQYLLSAGEIHGCDQP
ncbi:hypothetical protein CVV68_13010 [Arthrobacter livingstonensis]|uniref:LssY-like C-terminal domain-containing protein n=1 Tax=Arthrobacter livingstonensis TaxID=670078 RepID=A0A2V5L8L1_9MICC|nr:LssY C-terminal domain-containing protein [Arthrobacter livingstonensis]PYI66724.1 hypothetical protein CVV68_13010 [Arthrobacter livingstonensis]